MQTKLADKEQQLRALEKILVEKLKEVEVNFNDLGEHIQRGQRENLDKTKDSVFDKFLEHDDKHLEELSKENQFLHDEISQLRQKYKDTVTIAEHQATKEALSIQSQANTRLAIEKKELVKMFDVLTKERDNGKQELAKAKSDKTTIEDLLSKAQKELQATNQMAKQKEQVFEQSLKALKQ